MILKLKTRPVPELSDVLRKVQSFWVDLGDLFSLNDFTICPINSDSYKECAKRSHIKC